MYTDSHCHLGKIAERGIIADTLLIGIAESRMPFVLDAGTDCDDLPARLDLLEQVKRICGSADFLFFSAGIWPDPSAANDRFEEVKRLSLHLSRALSNGFPVCALGECGLDRHWNTDELLYGNEEELFELQIGVAKKLSLPLIVHSRDAFEPTLSCIQNSGGANGVIHCFSYGVREARAFLDEGFYLSLAGTVTYKKNNSLREVLSLIPSDRLLLETDAPYLAPVPCRGKTNTPLLIQHTYEYCASVLHMPVEELCSIVESNARRLFLSSKR